MPRQNTLATLGETPIGDAAYYLPAPQPFTAPQLPPLNLDLQTNYGNVPRVSAGTTLPLLGNSLELRGSYQHDPYLPDYSLMLGLRRQF